MPPPDPVRPLADAARRLRGAAGDYDALLDLIGDARVVLLGEASHGTHEFYEQRALITRRLILEKHFSAVAVEADWPDADRVNRYVRATGADRTADDALGDFKRFPVWMWRNEDVRDFVTWLRAHNDRERATTRARNLSVWGYDRHAEPVADDVAAAWFDGNQRLG